MSDYEPKPRVSLDDSFHFGSFLVQKDASHYEKACFETVGSVSPNLNKNILGVRSANFSVTESQFNSLLGSSNHGNSVEIS